uniref:programmed cell death protein 1 n=1 Tax=Semicossyphus pulcher TaxID=241346 RepID=UPI0037E827E9
MVGGAARSCWLLLTLFMKGVLAGDWSVDLPSGPIYAAIGSSVVLPCSYDYPRSSNETNLSAQDKGEVLSEMWCLEDSRCITQRYVYHSDGIFPDPSYQNRVEYLGRPGTKNCSLRISDLRLSDSGAYVFYLITKHPTQKMPEQSGVQLLVSELTLSKSSEGRWVEIGLPIIVTIGVLLVAAVIAIVAFLIWRRCKSSGSNSYVLTETTAIAR